MYRIVIWGVGKTYNRYVNCLKLQETLGSIEVSGITGKNKLYDYLDGYPYIAPHEIDVQSVDYLIVASEDYSEEITTEAIHIGFERECIFPIGIFALPRFDFGEYVRLVHSHISILSNTCWGGLTYHSLSMQFRSPLINMFETEEDYLKLLRAPKDYFNKKLQFDRWGYTENGTPYPICRLGDMDLYCNHYRTMQEVEDKWYARASRINYDNIFVMMLAQDVRSLEAFAALPYQKKICFTPFSSTYDCACTLQFSLARTEEPFWRFVNGIPRGMYHDYDVVSLLNSGKVDHVRTAGYRV